ncbi:MAG: hypothetical protein RLZZ558_121, partial [Planctomycetota bacterium]
RFLGLKRLLPLPWANTTMAEAPSGSVSRPGNVWPAAFTATVVGVGATMVMDRPVQPEANSGSRAALFRVSASLESFSSKARSSSSDFCSAEAALR